MIVVRPLGSNSATVDVAGQPLVTATNVSTTAGDFVVDGAAGSDAVTVEGNEDDNTITVNLTAASHVSFASLLNVNLGLTTDDSLSIAAGAGDDDITVTPDADIPIFVDGGDPIALSDTINVQAGRFDVTFAPGPESDEAGIAVDGFQTVS